MQSQKSIKVAVKRSVAGAGDQSVLFGSVTNVNPVQVQRGIPFVSHPVPHTVVRLTELLWKVIAIK